MSERTDPDKIYRRVQTIVSEVLSVEPDKILPESRFVEDLGADSFDNLSLFMMLEEELDVEIPEARAQELTTVASAVTLVQQVLQEKGSSGS